MLNDEKRTSKRPDIVYPTKVVKMGDKFKEKLSLIFSYKIIFFEVINSNINKVFIEGTCSFCNHNLNYADCYHKKDNLRVSLLRFCHYCKRMFVLTGRFESEKQFDEAFDFFDDYIYIRKRIKEEG
ncbi:hypothetical protein ES702_03501 [subsurface metagenome]